MTRAPQDHAFHDAYGHWRRTAEGTEIFDPLGKWGPGIVSPSRDLISRVNARFPALLWISVTVVGSLTAIGLPTQIDSPLLWAIAFAVFIFLTFGWYFYVRIVFRPYPKSQLSAPRFAHPKPPRRPALSWPMRLNLLACLVLVGYSIPTFLNDGRPYLAVLATFLCFLFAIDLLRDLVALLANRGRSLDSRSSRE